jgi:hypothetical protein
MLDQGAGREFFPASPILTANRCMELCRHILDVLGSTLANPLDLRSVSVVRASEATDDR